MRVRAWEREKPWAPRYVGNELAGTRQAAAHQHQTSALWAAEADAAAATGHADEHARLAGEAADAASLAAALDEQAATLQQLDDARARWLAHTAMTRVKAERAAAMLAERHATDADPDPLVTAEEWLAAHQASDTADEPHRAITDTDVAEQVDDLNDARDASTARGIDTAASGSEFVGRDADERAVDEHHRGTSFAVVDLREIAAAERAPAGEDVVRVPTAAQTAAGGFQAERALVEIRTREVDDQLRDEQERTAELARWHRDDQAERDGVNDDGLVDDDASGEVAGSGLER